MGMDFSKVFAALRSNDQKQFTDTNPNSPIADKNINAGFVYNVLSQWYWLIVGPALYVTYTILNTPKIKTILSSIYDNVRQNLIMLENLAENCPQHIENIELFFQCMSGGPY